MCCCEEACLPFVYLPIVVQSAIRVGDVFAVLVEFYYSQNNNEQAYRLIENMRQRGILLAPFLDTDLINTVYRCEPTPHHCP